MFFTLTKFYRILSKVYPELNFNFTLVLLQIELALDVEFMMPKSWRQHYTNGYYKIFRNKNKRVDSNIKDYIKFKLMPDMNSVYECLISYKVRNS